MSWLWACMVATVVALFVVHRRRNRAAREELDRQDEADDDLGFGKVADADVAHDPDAWRGDVHDEGDDESWRS